VTFGWCKLGGNVRRSFCKKHPAENMCGNIWGDDGRKTSVTGWDCGSTMQQDLRKTGTVGEGSYVPPTLQLEDSNRRRLRQNDSMGE